MGSNGIYGGSNGLQDTGSNAGRFPANLIHDGSDEVVGLFPSDRPGGNFPEGGKKSAATDNAFGEFAGSGQPARAMGDSGSAARFFYCAKASAEDRDDGCHALPAKSAGQVTGGRAEGSAGLDSPRSGAGRRRDETRNSHPTVKPTDLMRYLCRLVTPSGGLVLDPFVGSGSTGRGAALEGFAFIGIEREAEYVEIARARIDAAIRQRHKDTAQGSLF
jgi:site-specific DNA-methyltransferase (adenine-specific)